jgi:hypothetical protein
MPCNSSIEAHSRVTWWRPIVQGVLCIPHILWTVVLTVTAVAAMLGGWAFVLAGRPIPSRITGLQVLMLRERVRAYSYFFVLRSDYPPFATSATFGDPGDDPLVAVSAWPPREVPRRAVLRIFEVFPLVVVLLLIGALLNFGYPLWMVLAAIGGGWSPAVERFLVDVELRVAAIIAYVMILTDERPALGAGSGAGRRPSAVPGVASPPVPASRDHGN